jgi:hypothetical protein
MGRLGVGLFVAGLLAGCSTEPSARVTRGLYGATLDARAAIEKIQRSLPVTDRGFGEGVAELEAAVRRFDALEQDPAASDGQRLKAILGEARAWDDASRAILGAHLLEVDEPVAEEILREKAFPAKIAAANAYRRALAFACALDNKHGADADNVIPEILDGLTRTAGNATAPDAACR